MRLKRRPALEIELERTLPWTNFPDARREEAFLIREGINPNEDYDILSLKVPDETRFKRFNTKWRKWYWATGNYSNIKNFTKKIYRNFDYNLARNNNKNLGPWIFDIISDRNVWYILHFKDTNREIEWCYCKRFHFAQTTYPWKVVRNQLRNKLKSWKLFKHKECKNCLFQSKWDTKDLDEFEETEAGITVVSMLDTVFTPQDVMDEGHQLEMIEETEINEKGQVTIVEPKWETIYDNELIEVPPADILILKSMELKTDERLKGIATAHEEQIFSFYIMCEEEYAKYMNKEEFDPLFEIEEEAAGHIDITIPKDDIWYFVFDTFGKKNYRYIEFTLRRSQNM
jgi:hypothetical protein